jgi:hypothetical protein
LSEIAEARLFIVSLFHVIIFEAVSPISLLAIFSTVCATFSPSLKLNNFSVLAIKASKASLFHLSHLLFNSFIIEFANSLRLAQLFFVISSIILFASSFFDSNSLFIKSSSFWLRFLVFQRVNSTSQFLLE